MPIYPAIRIPNNAPQSVQYKAEGLSGLTCARLSQAGIFGFPLQPQVAYDVYKAQLPAFLFATRSQTKVPTNRGGYSFSLPITDLIPFPNIPPVHFRPVTQLRDNELVEWKNKITEVSEWSEVPHGKGIVYVIANPDHECFKKLTAIGVDERSPGPSNSCNIEGVRALFLWKKIVTVFLATRKSSHMIQNYCCTEF